ncbi:MAG: hypothetical protein A2275_17930 [Bacteroidetes bacterium RIFOXYA12_FULL_35_11]|nr:MAG: hypothetical protein A2X01_19060 [Bacteroidetes bacterium GWF2_35_48]OFY78532.1 MAG: hypothetical protein A2275_17930 [Bacteroidetes bacterium RIFOXYA12_FULL_35_11]OFY95832.1 MAG: hypothetical protein A2309_13380 [Bacteroidetes bacterium RIFOXYB2_FULL_35_7]OFY99029.1 MAG: hypothetical protein A2491_15355 [Bacteroidetes bacterium RIFOXYC12_FULL_35_7]HBX50734.1 hypothetical protein [Bacteroidales bacterium]
MKQKRKIELDFIVDKLTNSIENAITGDIFDTEIIQLSVKNFKEIISNDWLFDWKQEIRNKSKEVYKLTIKNNAQIIQGLISYEDKGDHLFMHLIESAKFNKGKIKIYLGIPGNLVAFACQQSFMKGYGGYVSFISKSKLIEHYSDTLGAKVLFANTMIIETSAALKLIHKYYNK